MAEAFFNRVSGRWRASSAGVRPDERVHPQTVEAMKQVGIDVSRRSPRRLTYRLLARADRVVVLDARALVGVPPRFASKVEGWRVPPLLGKEGAAVARVRDSIRARVERLRVELDPRSRNIVRGISAGRPRPSRPPSRTRPLRRGQELARRPGVDDHDGSGP